MDFGKVFDEISYFLEAGGYRYSIAGAFALHAYGITRATADLDFAVEGRARVGLLRHLRAIQYEELHVSEGYSNHVHPLPGLGRVDFIYVNDATAALLFGRARRLELLPGCFAPIPRPEHLAAMKILAMKNDPSRTLQEMADIQAILALRGIDEQEIRGYFVRHGLEVRFDEIKRFTTP